MRNHSCEVFGRCFTLHERARIGGVCEDGAIRKEAGIGHKDDLRIGAAVVGIVSDSQRTTVSQNKIENDYIGNATRDLLDRIVLAAGSCNLHARSLEMALPQRAQSARTLYNQNSHDTSVPILFR